MSTQASSTRLLVGIFVGGRGTRMGGVAKGLLPAPGSASSLVERLLSELQSALPGAPVLLVGAADGYAHLGLASIADEPRNIGPLGGLSGLLLHADREGLEAALAIACDLPYVTGQLIARLVSHAAGAAAVVAKHEGIRNPLFARYQTTPGLDATRRALATGRRSLQSVLDHLEPQVAELQLSASEAAELADWDTPSNVTNVKPPPR